MLPGTEIAKDSGDEFVFHSSKDECLQVTPQKCTVMPGDASVQIKIKFVTPTPEQLMIYVMQANKSYMNILFNIT